MHEQGIVHRDLKADNLLFANADRSPSSIRIADLGMAAAVPDGGLVAEKPISTAEWMPPELHCGGKLHGTAVDMWSFGTLLYMLCTGTMPFGDRRQPGGMTRLQERACRLEFTHPLADSTICKSTEAWEHVVPVMRRCFQLDPASRITADEAIKEISRSFGQRNEHLKLNIHAAEFVPPALMTH
jgi:serine/threonine protein kinase